VYEDQIREDYIEFEPLMNVVGWGLEETSLKIKFLEGYGYDGTLMVSGKLNGIKVQSNPDTAPLYIPPPFHCTQ
jgi:hypothetical protein